MQGALVFSSIQTTRITAQSSHSSHPSSTQRVIVYPNYVNADRTVAQGRRVPRVPGAEDPTAPEIYDVVVTGLKLPAALEVRRQELPWCLLALRPTSSLQAEVQSV